MKKRLFSILLALCMALCLVPTTAFAESETEETPVCTCETACTAEAMNADCPICGVEGALPENCAKCAQPADGAAVQPEGEVSDPQPEAALTAMSGEGVTPAAGETVRDVRTADELTKAIADSSVNTVKLTTDIDISNTLTVNRTVTLDLNGHVLQYKNDEVHGSPLAVEDGAHLTIKDSGSNATHKFAPNSDGLWVLDETNGTETVYGGVITGGTGYPIQFGSGYTAYYGGAVYIKSGGKLTMEGGNIVGCSAVYGGGVYVEGEFVMTGGSIIGCAADRGGGVYMRDNDAVFNMSGSAAIRYCKAASKDTSYVSGGGVYALGAFTMSGNAAICDCECITGSGRAGGGGVYLAYHNNTTTFTMSDNAVIENCKVTTSSPDSRTKSYGGGVFVSSRSSLTLKDQAAIRNCSAENTAGGATYGGGIFAEGTLTIAGLAEVGEGCSAAVGSGIYMEVGPNFIVSQNLYANGGVIAGEVVLNNSSTHGVTLKITGSDESVTEFKGSVLNDNGIIEKGKFTGEVTNNGTITGGVFTGTVSGSGTITGGTFNTLITGNGTENDPYQIGTAEGLKWFRDKVNNAKAKEETKICAVLTEDIDLNNEPWTPIGIGEDTRKEDLPYSGTFDGNGHTISGLNVNYGDKNGGLFCYVKSATIKNLTVAGSVTYSSGDGIAYGGIVGCADSSTIENCTNRCTVTGRWYDGGIVGRSVNTTITGCANFGNISISGFNCVGGICGYLSSYASDETSTNFSTIRDCYNVGSISGIYAGGIAGRSYNGDNSAYPNRIANCYNMGKVTTTASGCAGEILGKFLSTKDASLDNCYYLDTAGNNAVGQSNAQVTNTKSMTAAEFADGTVRKLLKDGERGNNADPWAGECKYLDAAGKTLPVFNGQGDAHDHQSNDWEHNDTEHWQVCTCGAVFNKAAHSGGKATCKDKAICEICGDSYGSLDPNNHTDLKHIDAKAATAAEEGNIAYWYCDGCKKYFSDAAAKTEIAKADTVTAKRSPQITAGDGAAVTQGEKKELTFTSDASFADFLRVELDGTALDEKNYTKREGSTIITLNRDFVATLSVGEHTLAIVSQHGTATAKFTVKAKPAQTATPQPTVTPQPTAQPQPTVQPVSPRTGDTANLALWFALLIVSGGAAIGITVVSRKKKHNK